ncbi:tripartite motif containing 101 isoform X3 [Scophthalmus maximus]|nr:tripartite motif containing 101 isoform X3 [Scophthalmus maximus]
MSLPADLSSLRGGGAADHEAALVTLEKQLICPICLELFNKPVVILPCQHNLCRKCANELYQPSLFQARTTMSVNSGRFRCPSCRQEVVLDRHGVYGLQRNLLVENIIDAYKQEVGNNSSSNAASPLPPPPPPAQPKCSAHEGEKVNIFCVTCQVPTCSLCKVFGAHRSCQVAPLTDVYQQQKDELSEGVGSLVAVNDRIQAFVGELEETCRSIEENCKAQKQSVCDKFDRMISILGERHKAMKQQISSEQEDKSGRAQAWLRCYGDSVEANDKLMERAVSSMEEPDMAAFVQNSRELITKVLAATSSCPTETPKPAYESMRPYKCDFSRQESALKSIDFVKVVEDVAQEPDVEPEPEEPKELSAQNTEPTRRQETAMQIPETEAEPVPETIPPLMSPAGEPAPAPAPVLIPAASAPQLPSDPEEPAGADVQPETDAAASSDEGSGGITNKKEEEKDGAEECAAPDSIKETNICDQEEGMSTQQREGGGADSGAGDWTARRETEGEQDAREDEEEEEDIQVEEGADARCRPSRYNQGAKQMMCSTQPAGVSLSEARTRAEAHDAGQAAFDPQGQPQPPRGPDSQLLSEAQTQIQERDTSQPQTQQTAGEAGMIQGEIGEGDMQGWECLPETVDPRFSLVEGSLNLGGGRSDNFSSGDGDYNNRNALLSIPPEETCSGMDKDNFRLRGGRVVDAEEKEKHGEEDLGLIGASELTERGEGRSEAEMMEEGSARLDERREEVPGDVEVATEDVSEVISDNTLGVGVDRGAGSTHISMQDEGAGAEFEAGRSVFAGREQEEGENSERPEDFKAQTETSAAESDEKITSCLSLQTETETRSLAETGPPLSSSSSSSSSSFPLSEAPRRPSFYFSWLNPIHKRK